MSTKPHFSILATSFAGGPRPRNTVLILSGLWVAIFFCSLFSPPLLDDADATHAQAARAMATTGDLVTLKVDGVRYLEKAPLPYWLEAASFRIFGYNTFAAHLPQAFAVLLLMLLGHRWANQAFGARTGFYTAIGVLTAVGVFLFTRILIPEVWLSLFLVAALFAFLKALGPVAVAGAANEVRIGEVQERPADVWYAGPAVYAYLMWGCVALAVLSKGLVALVFFFGTTVAYLTLVAEWSKWRLLRPFSGVAVFLAVAAPWHVLAGLRNQGGADGHGFWWFYLWNEHVLRFLGRRTPADYNKLPGWVYWGMHLVWLFPWALFLPLGVAAIWRRFRHQTVTLTGNLSVDEIYLPRDQRLRLTPYAQGWAWQVIFGFLIAVSIVRTHSWSAVVSLAVLDLVVMIVMRRRWVGLAASPFHRIDPQQKTILLLSLFVGFVLLFFSLSTNQEYYTFPAYLPVLLLIGATITRAEQTYLFDLSARRWVTFAHAAFAGIGVCVTLALGAALVASWKQPYAADLGSTLAHRGIGDYTLSMSHLFDLTSAAFAGLRLPAALAAIAFATGPALAWMLRAQRRHLAATTTIAFTAGLFLLAAHLAFARFAPMLSSEAFAARIQRMEADGQIAQGTQVMLYGDQAYGSSIPFYLGRQVRLVDGRSTSMLFGSGFKDVPPVFETGAQMAAEWGVGERKVLFVPLEQRDAVERLLQGRVVVAIAEMSGKELLTDRGLDR